MYASGKRKNGKEYDEKTKMLLLKKKRGERILLSIRYIYLINSFNVIYIVRFSCSRNYCSREKLRAKTRESEALLVSYTYVISI